MKGGLAFHFLSSRPAALSACLIQLRYFDPFANPLYRYPNASRTSHYKERVVTRFVFPLIAPNILISLPCAHFRVLSSYASESAKSWPALKGCTCLSWIQGLQR